MPYTLGIDVGTGSTKGVALGTDGKVLAIAQHHYGIDVPQPGYSEQNPGTIWNALVLCVQDIVTKLNEAPEAIGFSSAMHTLIPVDENGNALSPMMTWADTRSESIAQRIRSSPQGESIYRTTGTPIHPMSPLCKLIWLKENNADLFNIAHKFISIKEYIWYKLFSWFQVDYSIASCTGLFDIVKLCWSNEACKLAGLDVSRLSDVVDTNYTRQLINSDIAVLLKLPVNTLIVTGASDGCCANIGSDVNGTGTAALTIGTSGAVRVTGNAPVYDYGGMTFNYLLNAKTFVSGGAVNNGGIAVDWLLKNFLGKANVGKPDYDELFKAIADIPAGCGGLLFLPYLYGERAPIWDSQSSGAFINIKAAHLRDHFLRAGLEGICYALYDVMETLERLGVTINQVNISGGFITSPVWVQMLADITGKKLVTLQTDDASAIGAAYLAIMAVNPGQPLPKHGEGAVINPDAEKHKLYAKIFQVYRKLYKDLKKSVHLLDDVKL